MKTSNFAKDGEHFCIDCGGFKMNKQMKQTLEQFARDYRDEVKNA